GTGEYDAGNGSIMRLAHVPLFFASADREEAVRQSGESSRTTHAVEKALDGCRYLGAILHAAANGASKEEILSEDLAPETLTPEIAEVAAGSFKRKDELEIKGSGYVVESLEAALWAFYSSLSFEEGALLAVNLGDDADTTGAVYGQVAGAFYGAPGIPEDWLDTIVMRNEITAYADGLYRI
ncbi:MAG: ADP-ribosylglycohydrolase family protein, partial [Rubrobacter sp.]